MNKQQLEEKLKEIGQVIKSQYKNVSDVGVLSGLSGVSLFQFYYSKYLNIIDNDDFGMEILVNCVSKINRGYKYPTFCRGVAGFGWVLDHLKREKLIDVDNDDLLSGVDDYLYKIMIFDMRKGNYDFLHGGVGYAFYFLSRYRNTMSKNLKRKYKTILLEFLDLLENMSEKVHKNKYRWVYKPDLESKQNVCNLSLSHGMPSIVGILTKLFQYDDFKTKTEALLKGAIDYIMSFKNNNKNAFSLFPSLISKNNKADLQSRLAWCYGDLGIGIRFWHASKVLKNMTLEESAIFILKHATKRTTPEKSLVVDAGICHGSYGNAKVFQRIYKETGHSFFKDAAEFWIEDGLKKAIHSGGYAGYKKWAIGDNKWMPEISLLEGIAGVGLTIIDHLSEVDFKWDECLMIS